MHPQSSWGSLGPPAEAYSAAICSMWSLSSLYCSGRENSVIPHERDGDTDGQVLLIRGDDKAGPPRHGECGLLKVCPRDASSHGNDAPQGSPAGPQEAWCGQMNPVTGAGRGSWRPRRGHVVEGTVFLPCDEWWGW